MACCRLACTRTGETSQAEPGACGQAVDLGGPRHGSLSSHGSAPTDGSSSYSLGGHGSNVYEPSNLLASGQIDVTVYTEPNQSFWLWVQFERKVWSKVAMSLQGWIRKPLSNCFEMNLSSVSRALDSRIAVTMTLLDAHGRTLTHTFQPYALHRPINSWIMLNWYSLVALFFLCWTHPKPHGFNLALDSVDASVFADRFTGGISVDPCRDPARFVFYIASCWDSPADLARWRFGSCWSITYRPGAMRNF